MNSHRHFGNPGLLQAAGERRAIETGRKIRFALLLTLALWAACIVAVLFATGVLG